MANIYQGPNSCYAKVFGKYVPGSGVNESTVRKFIELILEDLYRGRTVDWSCRVIPMSPALAAARLRYLIPLAKRHCRNEQCYRRVVEEVEKALNVVTGKMHRRMVQFRKWMMEGIEGKIRDAERRARNIRRRVMRNIAKRAGRRLRA